MRTVKIEKKDSETTAYFHCKNCSGIRNCTVLSTVEKISEDNWGCIIDNVNDHYIVTSHEEMSIARCNGCDYLFFVQKTSFSEDYDVEGNVKEFQKIYPEDVKELRIKKDYRLMNRDGETDTYIDNIYREIVDSLNNNCYAVASMGIRALLDRTAVHLTNQDTGSFSGNIKLLETNNLISSEQLETLNSALEPGHGATHRGFIPTGGLVNSAMDIVETFFEILGPHKSAARRIKKAVPEFQKKSRP